MEVKEGRGKDRTKRILGNFLNWLLMGTARLNTRGHFVDTLQHQVWKASAMVPPLLQYVHVFFSNQ